MVLVYELYILDMKFDLPIFALCHSDVYLLGECVGSWIAGHAWQAVHSPEGIVLQYEIRIYQIPTCCVTYAAFFTPRVLPCF